MLANLLEGRLELTVTVDRNHGAGVHGLVQAFPEPGQHTGRARTDERTRARQLQQQHFLHPAMPVVFAHCPR